MSFELWPYQRNVVRRTQEALRHFRSVGIVLPTGSGKTAVSGDISLQVYRQLGERQGGVALYLVHRKELIRQTAETLDAVGLGDTYGIIAAGHAGKPWAPLQIASIPTMIRRLDKMSWLDPAVIFVDEGHHATARTWSEVIQRFPNAYTIMLTATPARMDDKGLGDMIDHLVIGPQIKTLTPDYLAPVRTYSVPPAFRLDRATLKAQSEQQTGPVIAKSVENWARLARHRKTIFFAVDLAHSEAIVMRLNSIGVQAAHIDYKTRDAERETIFDRMREGSLQVVSNVRLFTEGTDWPECSCVVLARNTGSLVEYRQMNGRCMRRKADGGDGMVIDLAGNVYIHGLPDDDIEWELEYGISKEEKSRLRSLNRQCEFCGYVYPKTEETCPLCLREPSQKEVTEIDQEMEEINEALARRRAKPSKRRLRDEVIATQGDLYELRKLRAKYGYNARWPDRMREVYKHYWPHLR